MKNGSGMFKQLALLTTVLLPMTVAAENVALRPPAVPLITHDPYFSIWSPADKLTDSRTTHWTGKPHRLDSHVTIGTNAFRLMGTEPADLPPLPQTSLEVWPTRTRYTFEGQGIRLTLTFMTPTLPDDLMICSRPVTYLTWQAQAIDGYQHHVSVDFHVSGELAVNDPAQVVHHSTENIPGLATIRIGSEEQPILRKKGDDLRIDWGHLYLAAPESESPTYCHSCVPAPGQRNDTRRMDYLLPGPASNVFAKMNFDLGENIGSAPVSRWLMLAYDDEFSIRYFREKLRPFWRRTGDDAAALLTKAAADYQVLQKRCADFDMALMADFERAGGEKYAKLCALAYRQTFAGNKIVADANGHPLMFPKENFSNGCIGTVDVLFPQAPFFLLLSPALTKAMLVPILDYAESPRWKFAYAPHDLGTYPHATGQVYGGGERSDENQMPVEESGNMLIMMAALARAEGNPGLATNYWPLLKKWADYCVEQGLDPANQLCSADMFGHLPRCANLALKAIIGIGGYAQLCEAAGKHEEAKRYLAVARDYAVKWQELAKGDGRTRLAYHLPGTWGIKHNLIWDRLLGLNLFPEALGDAEIEWYLKVQNQYGLPVDNRTETSLIDWAMWSIALARKNTDFQALLEPLFRYVNETPSRVPLSDWFVTTNAAQKGFQARPVVGGIYIKMLADQRSWRTRAGQGANTQGPWAPISLPPPTTEIVPTAQKAGVKWRYQLSSPRSDWMKPSFEDSAWSVGGAAFGTRGTPGAPIRTEWKTEKIWLRREFTLPNRPLRNPRLALIYDEDPEVYLNGIAAANLKGWTGTYEEVEISPQALATLKPGTNLLAVSASQTYGGQSIDVGLVEDNPLPGLRQISDVPLRDTSICRGPDGTWYLTGTVEPFWAYNEGIRLWSSKDLKTWRDLGMVWRYGASPWHKPYLDAKKPLWAPEVHYLKNTFWLCYSIPGWDGTGKTSGCGLLKSTSGKPEGPYEDVYPSERMGDEIDASLFQDDDGAVYFLWHSAKIARMNPEMTALAEPYRWLKTRSSDPNPRHHSGLCQGIFGTNSFDHLGYEGVFLFKANGRYYLSCAENFDGRYSCTIATATNVYGPYGERYEALPHAGHNMFFKDDQGRWWSTYFGSDPKAPWQERPGILPIRFDESGLVRADSSP